MSHARTSRALAGAALALTLAACSDGTAAPTPSQDVVASSDAPTAEPVAEPTDQPVDEPTDDPTDAGVVATADCSPPEQQRLQQGGHLLGDEPPPVPWNSVPPTSGWHSSGASVNPGAYAEPVSEADQVLWLEKGGIVVTYDPSLPDEVVGRLNRLPSQASLTVVTPYEVEMPTPIALTAWGWLQRCESVTPQVVEAFADTYGNGGVPH